MNEQEPKSVFIDNPHENSKSNMSEKLNTRWLKVILRKLQKMGITYFDFEGKTICFTSSLIKT